MNPKVIKALAQVVVREDVQKILVPFCSDIKNLDDQVKVLSSHLMALAAKVKPSQVYYAPNPNSFTVDDKGVASYDSEEGSHPFFVGDAYSSSEALALITKYANDKKLVGYHVEMQMPERNYITYEN